MQQAHSYNCLLDRESPRGEIRKTKLKPLRGLVERRGPMVGTEVWDAFGAMVAEQEGFGIIPGRTRTGLAGSTSRMHSDVA